MPKTNTNTAFWEKKISRDIERDKEEQKKLAEMGWHVIVAWECELKPDKREKTLTSLAFTFNHIFLQDHSVAYPHIEEESELEEAAEPMPEKSGSIYKCALLTVLMKLTGLQGLQFGFYTNRTYLCSAIY